MMIAKRNRQPDPRARLAQLTEDYESLAKEQKDRILALRNENAELLQRLRAYEESESALSAALVKAERTAGEIISAAKDRAEGIIAAAREEAEGGETITRAAAVAYKEFLLKQYRTTSANSMLIAVNAYLHFIGKGDLKLQTVRVQRKIFMDEEKELTREEYGRLVQAAEREGKYRLCNIIQTIGATGIRISELQFVTVESLENRIVRIFSKGKERLVLLSCSLVGLLRDYCRKQRITRGSIFITRSGRPVDRRNVWAEMKALCKSAKVRASKVFPHNLRHLFARCYYEKEKDLVRLADYLGHSSVETTRRYTRTASISACLKQLELGLLLTKKIRHNTDYVIFKK